MYKKSLFLIAAILTLTLAACGGGGGGGPAEGGAAAPAGGGDAARGKELYQQTVIGSAPGCVTCHSLEPGKVLVGPSHAGLATRAAEIIKSPNYTGKAKTVEEYLRESIVEPNAYVEEGFAAGIMYQNYGKDLSEQQINDLVAFLLTLK